MGASKRELVGERVRLKVDMSYMKSWSHPGWMYDEFAWGACALAGCMQYVGRPNMACDWCMKYDLC